MKYYDLSNKFDTCFEANVDPRKKTPRPWACRKCSTLPAGLGPPQSLIVTGKIRRRVALTYTSWFFGVIHIGMLEAMGPRCANLLRLGGMVDPQGKPIADYRTFVGVHRAFARGEMHTLHYVCKACGAMNYPPAFGKLCLTEASMSDQFPVYGLYMMGLLVDETVLAALPPEWRSLVKAEELPIKPEAADGLPAKLSQWPTPEELSSYKHYLLPCVSI